MQREFELMEEIRVIHKQQGSGTLVRNLKADFKK